MSDLGTRSEKQDAVVRNLEIIGEAVRNIPPNSGRSTATSLGARLLASETGSSISTPFRTRFIRSFAWSSSMTGTRRQGSVCAPDNTSATRCPLRPVRD